MSVMVIATKLRITTATATANCCGGYVNCNQPHNSQRWRDGKVSKLPAHSSQYLMQRMTRRPCNTIHKLPYHFYVLRHEKQGIIPDRVKRQLVHDDLDLCLTCSLSEAVYTTTHTTYMMKQAVPVECLDWWNRQHSASASDAVMLAPQLWPVHILPTWGKIAGCTQRWFKRRVLTKLGVK